MIELKPVLNLKADILQFLNGRNGTNHLKADDILILNQEKDGAILYTWNGVDKGKSVTHVGLYEASSRKQKVIWIYTQRLKMVSCSINQEKTLLAFTEFKTVAGHGRRRVPVYSAFLAELQGVYARVFSLNMELSNFIKVQFLYGDLMSTKDSRLLVMFHKESIGLYHIPLGRVGDKGTVMREQPKTEQITRRFVWCQWDAQCQHLHYIHYDRLSNSEDQQKEPIMSSIQFFQDGTFKEMLEIPITGLFPKIRSSGKSHYSRDLLHDGIPDTSLNVRVLTNNNGAFCLCYQELLSDSPDARHLSSDSSVSDSPFQPLRMSQSSQHSGEQTNEFKYHIYIVHHAMIIQGCVSSSMSRASPEALVRFVWHGDYLMVFSPGQFVHLLNVGIEIEPCHHILLHGKSYSCLEHRDIQRQPASDGDDSVIEEEMVDKSDYKTSTQGPLDARIKNTHSLLSSKTNSLSELSLGSLVGIGSLSARAACLMDCKLGVLWHPVINSRLLLQIFSLCYTADTRCAILHYALFKLKDFKLIKKMFEILSKDISSLEVPILMAEFLTATVYCSMKREFDREMCRLLPVTVCEPLRGQIEKNEDGELLATLSYSSIKNIKIESKTSCARHQSRHQSRGNAGCDIWDSLRHHLRLKRSGHIHRFSQDRVHKASEKLQKEKKVLSIHQTHIRETEFLPSTYRRQKSSDSQSTVLDIYRPVHSDTVLGDVPYFLHGKQLTESSEEVITLTREMLTSHLFRYLRKDSKVKAANVAKEYANCQIQQSHKLCHLLWSLRGPLLSCASQDSLPNLYEPICDEEYKFFQMLERYYVTVSKRAFPIPKGFHSLFTVLGFRSLDFSVFLQYVDAGVLQLTGEFMELVLSDILDDPEGTRMKYQIISRLPTKLAQECYRHWKTPLSDKYLARSQVRKQLWGNANLSDESAATDVLEGQLSDSHRSSLLSISDSAPFRPLSEFLKMLEDSAKKRQLHTMTLPGSRENFLNTSFLEATALHHTRTEMACDLGTVNF